MAAGEYSYADLRSAIERREVVPYFQPIVELSSGRLWGFEMLARWHHPERGVVSPAHFIPMAEHSWLLAPLFESLCEQAFELATTLPNHLIWSVNITARQMLDRGLPKWIWSIAERSKMPLRQITVELTETGLVEDFGRAQKIAEELKELGVRLAMDDFGTGYSGLISLKNIPLDEIKIDQSFIGNMDTQRDSRKIAAAVAGLGESLSLATVAEGVEQQVHADMLYFMGCKFGQGYLYSRPVPASETLRLVEQGNFASISSAFLVDDQLKGLEVMPSFRLAQYKAILDGLEVGIGFIDREFRYRNLNKWWMNQLDAAGRLGKTIQEVSPHNFRQIEPYLQKGLDGESTYDIELHDTDGPMPRIFSVSIFPVCDEAREVIGLCLCVGDVTDRRQGELRSLVERYKQPLSQHGITFFAADANGQLTWSGMTILGTKTEQVLGEAWIDLLHPDDRERVPRFWREHVAAGRPFVTDFRLRAADGSWHHTMAQVIPKLADDGKVLEWSGFLQDVTAFQERLHAVAPPIIEPEGLPSKAPVQTCGSLP